MIHPRALVRPIGFFAVLLSLATLLGCATTPPPAPVDAKVGDYHYRIGPLDNINIVVWRNPELSITVPVRPDGRITTPLVDDLMAMGKTPTELERELEQVLVKFIREPVVTVIVTGFVGPTSEQIRIVGEATRPQTLPYRQGMTLLDVMIAVGGITDFADGNAARLIRNAEGATYTVRLRDLIKRGDISANIGMRPGDILIIPESWF